MRNRTLNIPIARLSKALENEEAFEVFCASVIIKEHFEFSTLHTKGKPIKALMKCLHCKYNTAKRVFDAMLKSKAVSYCEKNGVLFCKPFRNNMKSCYHGYKATSEDNVYKLKYDKDQPHTLREIKKMLRLVLLKNDVLVRQRATYKTSHKNSVEIPEKKQVQTHRMFGKRIGRSKSTVSRYIKQMVNDGVVRESKLVSECVIPHLNDVTAKQWYAKNPKKGRFFAWRNVKTGEWSGWQTLGKVYTMNDAKEERKFMHLLWNHVHRVTTKFTKKGIRENDLIEGNEYLTNYMGKKQKM